MFCSIWLNQLSPECEIRRISTYFVAWLYLLYIYIHIYLYLSIQIDICIHTHPLHTHSLEHRSGYAYFLVFFTVLYCTLQWIWKCKWLNLGSHYRLQVQFCSYSVVTLTRANYLCSLLLEHCHDTPTFKIVCIKLSLLGRLKGNKTP